MSINIYKGQIGDIKLSKELTTGAKAFKFIRCEHTPKQYEDCTKCEECNLILK